MNQDNLAVDAPLELGVRPSAWLLEGTQTVEFDEQRYHNGSEWTALYDQAALKAAVAAERERWVSVCRSIANDLQNQDVVRMTAATCLYAGLRA